MTSTETRRVTLSARNIANMGPRYWDQFVGLDVVWTSRWDGAQRVGVVEAFTGRFVPTGTPLIRFPDGSWALGTLDLDVVQSAGASQDRPAQGTRCAYCRAPYDPAHAAADAWTVLTHPSTGEVMGWACGATCAADFRKHVGVR